MRREQIEAIGAGLLVLVTGIICVLAGPALGFLIGRITA